MFRRLFFLHPESAAVRLRHSGHMLPASEVEMVVLDIVKIAANAFLPVK